MDEDLEVDADMAAQMGFSSFGNQPKAKKQKTDAASSATGPNATAQGSKAAQPTTGRAKAEVTAPSDSGQADARKPDQRSLRQGVRNERGDMVFFLPSFIEDPWRALRNGDGT